MYYIMGNSYTKKSARKVKHPLEKLKKNLEKITEQNGGLDTNNKNNTDETNNNNSNDHNNSNNTEENNKGKRGKVVLVSTGAYNPVHRSVIILIA